MGTEAQPFEHEAQIVMHGHLRSPELPIYGAKTLGVRNGTLDLHGRPVAHTWTLLAATAEADASQVYFCLLHCTVLLFVQIDCFFCFFNLTRGHRR